MGRIRERTCLALLALTLTACQTPRWPIRAPIRSPFGLRLEGLRPDVHRGVDLTAPTGTPVHPVLNGRVRLAGVTSGYGQVIWIDHGEDLLSLYAHLSAIHVQAGDAVEQRQIVGLTGASGNAQGPHLHLEIWRWGREVDSVVLLGGPPR